MGLSSGIGIVSWIVALPGLTRMALIKECTSTPRRSVTTSATWGIDTSFRYLGLAKTPMASGFLPDTVSQPRFFGVDV